MTTTYDPHHEAYVAEDDVRRELARAFDICHDCRLCVDRCTSFPTLFEMLAGTDGSADELTPAQQDDVVDRCFQCGLCHDVCPYRPELHEAALDMPRLMLRASAMQHAHGRRPARTRTAARVMGRTKLVGRLGSAWSGLANRLMRSAPGSPVRRVLSRTGVSGERRLPTFAGERFSVWFDRRPRIVMSKKQAAVTVLPTCLVEYQRSEVGKDLVKVYERNGFECRRSGVECCGAPLLHSGDVDRFARTAARNVATLADEIRSGTEIVIPEPGCGRVIRTAYVDHVPAEMRADAELVAEHLHDASAFLVQTHAGGRHVLDTDFDGPVPASVAYHLPPSLQGRDAGYCGRDLMKLTGARVRLVVQPSGTEGIWTMRDGRDDAVDPIADRLAARIEATDAEIVAGDGHLANVTIEERTGRRPVHPLSVLARAYGISEEL